MCEGEAELDNRGNLQTVEGLTVSSTFDRYRGNRPPEDVSHRKCHPENRSGEDDMRREIDRLKQLAMK